MGIRLVDIVNDQLIDDCDEISLFVEFVPDDNTLFGFGIEKGSNDQKDLDRRIPVGEIEESILKKWMMFGLCFGIQIYISESNGTVTATAHFRYEEIFSFTASTLEDAIEGLKREIEGFNFEELQNEFRSREHTWDESLNKIRVYRAKMKKGNKS